MCRRAFVLNEGIDGGLDQDEDSVVFVEGGYRKSHKL